MKGRIRPANRPADQRGAARLFMTVALAAGNRNRMCPFMTVGWPPRSPAVPAVTREVAAVAVQDPGAAPVAAGRTDLPG